MAGEDSTRFYRGRSMGGTFCPGDCLTVSPAALGDVGPAADLGVPVYFRGVQSGVSALLDHPHVPRWW